MRKKLILLPILLFILYILVCPTDAVNAASAGLMLWYQKVLPTLLPFAILSNILIESNYLMYLTKYFYPLTRCILPTSEAGSYAFLSGFLFGFPMGSKNCATLYQKGCISKEEAEILTIICNNISPIFILSYLMTQQLELPAFGIYAILLLYLPAVLLGNYLLRRHVKALSSQKMPASRSQISFKIIDTGIMNGFETLTKLGGYIMLFSMLAAALKQLPVSATVQCILVGIIEITNGIACIPQAIVSKDLQLLLAIGFTAFGGLSGLAQTCSVTKGCPFSMKKYLCYRLLLTAITVILTFGLLQLRLHQI